MLQPQQLFHHFHCKRRIKNKKEFSETLRPIAARHRAVMSGGCIATPLVACLLEKYLLAVQQVARSHKMMSLADLHKSFADNDRRERINIVGKKKKNNNLLKVQMAFFC